MMYEETNPMVIRWLNAAAIIAVAFVLAISVIWIGRTVTTTAATAAAPTAVAAVR